MCRGLVFTLATAPSLDCNPGMNPVLWYRLVGLWIGLGSFWSYEARVVYEWYAGDSRHPTHCVAGKVDENGQSSVLGS